MEHDSDLDLEKIACVQINVSQDVTLQGGKSQIAMKIRGQA